MWTGDQDQGPCVISERRHSRGLNDINRKYITNRITAKMDRRYGKLAAILVKYWMGLNVYSK